MKQYQILSYWNKGNNGKVYLNYIAYDIEFRYNFPIKAVAYNEKTRDRINNYLKYNVRSYTFDSIMKYFETNNSSVLVSESYYDFINKK